MAASVSLPMLSGAKWRAAHQFTVDGVLGAGQRRVESRGTRFMNQDTWTSRAYVSELTKWAKANPGRTPSQTDVSRWVDAANAFSVDSKKIVIASTPDDLPLATAMALVGGGYHESWHTVFSRRTPLLLHEVLEPTLRRWALVKDWSKMTEALLQWGNIVEDIRIERLGCKKYPGSPEKMEALQDLILTQEEEGLAKAKRMGAPVNNHIRVINGAFRDLGLGYKTGLQEIALRDYQKSSPQAWDLVTVGALRPFLDRSINLTAKEDLESLWISMDIVAVLEALVSTDPSDQQGDGDGEGSGEKDGSKKGSGGPKDKSEEKGKDSSKGDDSKGDDSKGKNSSKKGGSEEEKKEESGNGDGSDKGEEPSDDGDSGEGEEPGDGSDDSDASKGVAGAPGGGHHEVSAEEIRDFVKELLEAIKNGGVSGLKDLSAALEEAITGEVEDDVLRGEHSWRPSCPEMDEVRFATGGNQVASRSILDSVRRETATMKARLRAKFLEARRPITLHGVACGSDLSDRRMIDSLFEIRCGQDPTRPDEMKLNRPECSLAVAVVIDQSGSMHGMRADATRAMAAIVDSLDSLHCPVLCVGPRNGKYDYNSPYSNDCHRNAGVIIDVFKNWDEPMNRCLARFSATTATGGTPLEDGIQYALQSLSHRKERHRLVIVITDGCPDRPDVCTRQIRLAAEAGVSIIGVGIGGGAEEVKRLFKFPIVVPKVSDLPVILVKTLESIVFPKVGGKKIALDGTFGGKSRRF